MWKKLAYLLTVNLLLSTAFVDAKTLRHKNYPYVKPNEVSQDHWNLASSYFLPTDHPIKLKLDKIFHKSYRVTSSEATLKRAGFYRTTPRPWRKTIVAMHTKLDGYLVKMFTDDQLNVNVLENFINRIIGARAAKEFVISHDYESIFKVPNKWIYPLPSNVAPFPTSQGKYFVLIVEDMDIVCKEKNIKKWASASVPKETLKALYNLVKDVGLSDTLYLSNIPFTKDGKIAIIDTEYHHSWPVEFGKILPDLRKGQQDYWWKLIETDGQG